MKNMRLFRTRRVYVIRDRCSGYYVCRSLVDDGLSSTPCIEYATWFDTALEAKDFIESHGWKGYRVVLWEERLYDLY